MSIARRPTLRYYVQHSPTPVAGVLRGAYRRLRNFSFPAPSALVKPALRSLLLARSAWHFCRRVFFAEPLFKAYCESYGRNLHTGIFLHWVQGSGRIVVGDDATLDGKIGITFTSAYRPDPTLSIGNKVTIGHNCAFTIGKRITIGDGVMIAGNCSFLDTSGHPTDPELRLRGLPAPEEKVRPITIGDRAWIGQFAIVLPGTTIGEGAVVAAHSVARGTIPAFEIWGGNPAVKIGEVTAPRNGGG